MLSNFVFFGFFLITNFLLRLTQTVEQAEPTLRSAQLVFRHGEKNADGAYEERSGLLTNTGKQEMYYLGKLVRERYAGFLKEDYDPAEVKIITSGAYRCIQSGALFAYGLYEEYNLKANWSSTVAIPFDPIPVEPIPPPTDKYLHLTDDCPARGTLKNQISESYADSLFEVDSFAKDFLDACATNIHNASMLPNPKQTSFDIFFACSQYIEPSQDREIAAWAEPYVDLYNVFAFEVDQRLRSCMALQQLQEGPFFEMLFANMENAESSVIAYATHDFSLNALRGLFEQEMEQFPGLLPTASAFLLEVHQLPEYNEPVLEVYFILGSSSVLTKIEDIPGCSSICFVSNFGSIVKPYYIPDDYDELCKNSSCAEEFGSRIGSLAIVMLVSLALVVSVVCIAVIVLFRSNGNTRSCNTFSLLFNCIFHNSDTLFAYF